MNDEREIEALLALSLSRALSLKHLDLYYSCFKSYHSILNLPSHEFKKIKLLKKDKSFEGRDILLKQADLVRKECKKLSIQWVTRINHFYPTALNNIYLPPLVLYYKTQDRLPPYYLGDKETNYLAIVGTRSSDPFIEDLTQTTAHQFTENRGHIISGLAAGIDYYAHRGACQALEKGAYSRFTGTTAVLASGIDYIYPYSNRFIYQKILDLGGVIMSEHPPGVKPATYLFPIRNRIISGLSEAILVSQAPQRSGALITVNYALDQGRTIYSFDPQYLVTNTPSSHKTNDNNPPPSHIPESMMGNYLLIQQGALPFVKPSDLFNLIGKSQLEKFYPVKNNIKLEKNSDSMIDSEIESKNKNDPKKTASTQSKTSSIREILFKALSSPKNLDELSDICRVNGIQMNLGQLTGFIMENLLSGSIKELPGNRYYALIN